MGGTTDIDEVWIYASNTDSSAIKLTLEFGGTTAVDDNIVVTVAAESTELVCPGLIIQNGLVIKAFAGTANKITLVGYVNRMDY